MELYFKLPQSYQSSSMFYKMTVRVLYGNFESLRLIWQRNLKVDTDRDWWLKIISRVGWFIREAQGKFTHYKILDRYYFTATCLHKMGLLENSLCWKCKRHERTFLHAMWACPLVLPFWQEIIRTILGWLSTPVAESIQLCLLGDRSCFPAI